MINKVITRIIGLAASFALLSGAAKAGEADVLGVNVRIGTPGVYSFDVTVKHGDTGWDHYADKWEIVGPKGKILGTRVLAHPHEAEQPFTRSLGGVTIPVEIKTVTVRAHDKVHGFGGKELIVKLAQ